MFEAAGLLDSGQADALSLRGRLLKDRALKGTGDQRALFFEQAEDAYLRAAGDRRATYPLINAATIAFLNGKEDRARALAQRTLDLLDSGVHEPETAYWIGATRAEAHLLLGNVAASKAALEQAVAGMPEAWEDHAATLRQLQLIRRQAGEADDIFNHLRPPASLHFSGLIHLPPDEDAIRALIGTALDEISPGFVFGALAAGSDILIAEMAVARGAQLHVVLPAPVDVFRDVSVAPFGAQWVQRFDSLMKAADAVETLDGVGALSDAAVTLGEEIAMGLAIRRAQSLASEAVALRISGAADKTRPAEAAWRSRGFPVRELVIDRAMLSGSPELAHAERRVTIASAKPFPPDVVRASVAAPRFSDGFWLLELHDPGEAVDLAVANLRLTSDTGLGLVYHIATTAPDDEDNAIDIAKLLARAAPQGRISAACPAAFAIALHTPYYHFEAAGEMVTQFGDIPISQFALPAAG